MDNLKQQAKNALLILARAEVIRQQNIEKHIQHEIIAAKRFYLEEQDEPFFLSADTTFRGEIVDVSVKDAVTGEQLIVEPSFEDDFAWNGELALRWRMIERGTITFPPLTCGDTRLLIYMWPDLSEETKGIIIKHARGIE